MTENDLLSYGYVAQNCKIGKLYFKEPFFCSIKENGQVDFRYSNDDMKTIAVINSKHELGLAEKKYFEDTANVYDKLAEAYRILAKNYIVPED